MAAEVSFYMLWIKLENKLASIIKMAQYNFTITGTISLNITCMG